MSVPDAPQADPRITEILGRVESRTFEFKRMGSKHGRILETVCAFANSEGGVLAIGVEDAKQLKPGAKPESRLFGIEENLEAFDDLRRELMQRFTPPIEIDPQRWIYVSCTLHNEQPGHIVLLQVDKSDQVHSVLPSGTYVRMDASNRQMTAAEITELSYRRGVRSAVDEVLPVSLDLLATETWRRFTVARGLRTGSIAEQLERLGLAKKLSADEVRPSRAAVLLFADEPGSLLAAHGSRADIRLMVYDGKTAEKGATPNLRKASKTIRGPLIHQIDAAVRTVLDELSHGITLSSSGFKSRHVYPERVVKEAIVNAVIHRDYRLNRDIFIRVFDDHIEIESPGRFLGNITPQNINKTGSKARNPLIAQNLREFPEAPNFDAGEGVKMMFEEMVKAKLYPPLYAQNLESAVESVTVTLRNHERPTDWDVVSDWMDRNGSIANRDLLKIIPGLDTLKASKKLREWVSQGVLVALRTPSRQKARYGKPGMSDDQTFSLSRDPDNEIEEL